MFRQLHLYSIGTSGKPNIVTEVFYLFEGVNPWNEFTELLYQRYMSFDLVHLEHLFPVLKNLENNWTVFSFISFTLVHLVHLPLAQLLQLCCTPGTPTSFDLNYSFLIL